MSPIRMGRATVRAVSAAELMGTRRLMDFADGDPRVEVRDSRHAHNPLVLGTRPGLVSVNSAIEVDLLGQVGSELAGARRSTAGPA